MAVHGECNGWFVECGYVNYCMSQKVSKCSNKQKRQVQDILEYNKLPEHFLDLAVLFITLSL